MKVIVTAREALDGGYWLELCDIKGINEWVISEGLMDDSEEIELTAEEVETIGVDYINTNRRKK